uniref:Uncharacterized protein n=1 Tax=Musca domestica TaxID=7370 RepID=A0A1I8MHA5_MUSDO
MSSEEQQQENIQLKQQQINMAALKKSKFSRSLSVRNETRILTTSNPVTISSASSSSSTTSSAAIVCPSASLSLIVPTQNITAKEISMETKDFNDNYKQQPNAQQLQRPSPPSSSVSYISHQQQQHLQTTVNEHNGTLGQGRYIAGGTAAAASTPLDSTNNLSDDSFSFCFISALLGLH